MIDEIMDLILIGEAEATSYRDSISTLLGHEPPLVEETCLPSTRDGGCMVEPSQDLIIAGWAIVAVNS